VVRAAVGAAYSQIAGAEVCRMRFRDFSFGSLRVDGETYDYDLVIDRGKLRKRRKTASKRFKSDFGHTPLSIEEDIPWKCQRLVIGTGAYGRLPVMDKVKREAKRRKVELVELPTAEAIQLLNNESQDTNAILHLTC